MASPNVIDIHQNRSVPKIQSYPRSWIVFLFIIAAGLIFSIGYLKTTSQWWYEDDPGEFIYVKAISNPLAIFTDPKILKQFTTGQALVPMQLLSLWIDARLFGYEPFPAYVHNLVVLLLVMVLLYAVLVEWTKNQWVSLLGSVIWLLLPSTIAVHEFISARHYMEGLACALAVVWLVQKKVQDVSWRGMFFFLIVAVLSIQAMLFKEIYATILPVFLFLSGLNWRKYAYLGLSVALVGFYGLYRLGAIGMSIEYTMPLVGIRKYIRFLIDLPYMLTASKYGYIIYIGISLLTIWLILKDRRVVKGMILAGLSTVAALVALYPVTYALLSQYQTPGTWYRVPFIINTIFLLWGMYVLAQTLPRRGQIITLAVVGLLVLPGTVRTQQHWDFQKGLSRAEAMFYLSNPDKLLFSESDAYWFIIGVHKMYFVSEEHYILQEFRKNPQVSHMLSLYKTIWRYQDGHFISDDNLYQALLKENNIQH